jgi:Ca-activated chloride channel family protein
MPVALLLLFAQVVINPPRPAANLSIDVTLVNVYCTVRDKQGAFVRDLAKADFEVREDGKRQEIKLFARDVDSPLTIAMLLDVSGSVAPFVNAEKATAARFFRDFLQPGDKALVAGFDSRIAIWRDLTASAAELEAALENEAQGLADRSGFSPRGGTLLFDAVKLIADRKLRRPPSRKVIILVTDGLDSGSIADARAASRAAQEADAVLYGIHFGSNAEGYNVVEDLAEPTGGRAFRITPKMPLDKILETIREEMRSQYGLAYTPPERAPDGTYHLLDVKTKRQGLKVQARQGYYAIRR